MVTAASPRTHTEGGRRTESLRSLGEARRGHRPAPAAGPAGCTSTYSPRPGPTARPPHPHSPARMRTLPAREPFRGAEGRGATAQAPGAGKGGAVLRRAGAVGSAGAGPAVS